MRIEITEKKGEKEDTGAVQALQDTVLKRRRQKGGENEEEEIDRSLVNLRTRRERGTKIIEEGRGQEKEDKDQKVVIDLHSLRPSQLLKRKLQF